MAYNLDALLSARDAAHAFQTSIPVILMWRNRGWLDDGEQLRLPVAGRSRTGRPLYRWGDLLVAERGTRISRERTGLPPRMKLASPYERCRA